MLPNGAIFALLRAYARSFIGLTIAIAIVFNASSIAVADTVTGVLSGIIKSTPTNAPVAGAKITIASPSGSRSTTSDARGFFSFTGVSPDTYTASVSAPGFADFVTSGITVNASQTTTFSPEISTALKTIGRIGSRSQTSAFQPTQTQNTYTVSESQINTILGNQFNNNETSLITALPGASLDAFGYPVLRGGRENEEGFQFDGIDYTDAFTHQFVNSLALNGQSSFQLTPGAGDASTGNAGTGAINVIVKKGTYPAFGTADIEAGTPAFNHQLSLEYGFATPNGRFSDFVSIIDTRTAAIYGYRNADLVKIGQASPNNYNTGNDFVNNFIYKFGKQNSQQVQFLYQNQEYDFFLRAAPGTQFNFRSSDPVAANYYSFTGFSPATLNSIYGLSFGQTSPTQTLASVNRNPANYYQPNETLKLQYSNVLNDSTFFSAKFYKVQSITTFDFPYNFNTNPQFYGSSFTGDFSSLQGGQRTGFTLDLTKQLGSKNLLTVGSKFDFLHPVYSFGSASSGFADLAFTGVAYDFVPATNADCAGPITTAFGSNPCGYLTKYFPNGIPRVPQYNQTTATNRQDTAFYFNDKFTPSTRLNIEAGLRLDMSNTQLPAVNSGAYLPASGGGYSSGYYLPVSTGLTAAGVPDPSKDVYDIGGKATRTPQVYEPRIAASYAFRPTDAVRVSYGRSAELVPLGDVDHVVARSNFNAFNGIPANPNAKVCGPTFDRVCRDYADELYWVNANIFAGPLITPAKPATFNNFDFSYSHDFGHGVSVKLNPFYRRGYDGLALVQTPLVVNGQPVLTASGAPVLNPAVTTNNGVTRTAGAELYLTKESEYGLSGTLSANYINEFSNVIPNSPNEDFFPTIPLPSLQLGNQYRVGFVSPFNLTLAAAYKTRSGFKISPNIAFNRGFPYGAGNITAIDINGKPVNVTQTNLVFGATNTGSIGATNYVDPQNPGSVFAPHIAATRGTPEGASPGAYLTTPRARVNLDLEYSPPRSRSTFGVQIFNLFNQVYTQPELNYYYQPVATGISGPATGTYALAQTLGPNLGFANFGSERFGNAAYTISPWNTPLSFQFYYHLKL